MKLGLRRWIWLLPWVLKNELVKNYSIQPYWRAAHAFPAPSSQVELSVQLHFTLYYTARSHEWLTKWGCCGFLQMIRAARTRMTAPARAANISAIQGFSSGSRRDRRGKWPIRTGTRNSFTRISSHRFPYPVVFSLAPSHPEDCGWRVVQPQGPLLLPCDL